jgi:hypothetical protein
MYGTCGIVKIPGWITIDDLLRGVQVASLHSGYQSSYCSYNRTGFALTTCALHMFKNYRVYNEFYINTSVTLTLSMYELVEDKDTSVLY